MRHRVKSKKLGRSSTHRKAMVASLVCGLIEQKRIRTSLQKARQARSLAEKMVTFGKKGTLASRREIIADLRDKKQVARLINDIVPECQDRNGGYTRIVKVGPRLGDGAEMAILEWVSIAAPNRKKPKKDKKDKKAEEPGK